MAVQCQKLSDQCQHRLSGPVVNVVGFQSADPGSILGCSAYFFVLKKLIYNRRNKSSEKYRKENSRKRIPDAYPSIRKSSDKYREQVGDCAICYTHLSSLILHDDKALEQYTASKAKMQYGKLLKLYFILLSMILEFIITLFDSLTVKN